jgi:cytochrome P450
MCFVQSVAMTATRRFDPIDLSSTAFWTGSNADRHWSFDLLRAQRPVSWQRPVEGGLLPPDSSDPGYWALMRHRDVSFVSRHPELFCSGQGVMMEQIPVEVLEASSSFLAMDAPRHTVLRRLVSSAFTPRQVARIDAQIAAHARDIVRDLIDHGPGDVVALVSERLPMWTISELVGVEPDARSAVTAAANAMVGWNDPEVCAGRPPLAMLFDAMLSLHGVAGALAAERRSQPADDLMTALVQAEVDGTRLTDAEIAAFFVLLAVAGNDTTRNTITHGLLLLTEHRDQRRLLLSDVDGHLPGAIDEMIRHASPVMTFRRTALSDMTIGDVDIAAGDNVVMFYGAANRDPSVFVDPHRFDITRSPNPHVGFGGGGPHYCLGAALARTQLRCMFTELLTRVPDIHVDRPQFLVGNFINGVSSARCTFGGR